ncbi:MAG: DUF4118 domain-containing protein [Planctomyces sp.]|jgi:two-component system sensor histidine kinase KdpD
MTTERPNADELLSRVREDEDRQARGRLRIFFGMAPGVGKTYTMLEAARKEAKAGSDVVVGYVEPHARPETHALLLGLELLPLRTVTYRGQTIREFDLEAALDRKPQLILVDELAHTNAEGMTHSRRWQDVEDLLAAGISVYTTLNVQHIESLNDVVAQVTSVPVRETVPDHVFERADEVELVDLAPDELIERLKHGKVYVSEQALRAIENFFRKGNLIVLRELALRKTAERVSAQAIDYRQQNAVAAIWPTSDRLLVCVGPSPMSARLVRATRRIATTLRAPWTALHVELGNTPQLTVEDRARLEENLQLAESLGGRIEFVSGTGFADAVISHCRRHNITRIIVGKPQRSWWDEFWRGSWVYDLIRRCGDIDVYVISGDREAEHRSTQQPSHPESGRRSSVFAILAVAACACLAWLFSGILAPTNLAMIFMAGVVAVSLTLGRRPTILATFLSVVVFDVGFVPPYGQLAVSDSQYLITFVVMLTTGLIVSELAERVRHQSRMARERERRTAALLSLSRELSEVPTREGIIESTQRILSDVFESDVHVFTPQSIQDTQDTTDAGVIRWVFENRQIAGAGTSTLPGTDSLYVPLLTGDSIQGVLGVRCGISSQRPETRQIQLLQAFAAQTAAALQRCELAEESERIRIQSETERLRNSLLSAVSHDLRTPLATLTGAASTLADQGSSLTEAARTELAESILDESDRMHRLVTNLLDLTRLEAGAIILKKELQPIDEVIGVALKRLDRQLRDHAVRVSIEEGLPAIMIDELLMQQVFTNLLDNAAKFSPPGTEIDVTVRSAGGLISVAVSDRGPGITAGDERRIFEKFFRSHDLSASGSGIGLAICRGVIELHGGTISAVRRADGGASIRFSLPLA